MDITKSHSVYISPNEVVDKSTSIELLKIIRGALYKIKNEYRSNNAIHKQYLEEFKANKRHSTEELTKYQKDCVKTTEEAVASLGKMILEFQETLKKIEAYQRVRGFKGQFP